MSNSSENLQLPYIIGGQAQKHVTHNEALAALDALVQLSVKSRRVSSPPASPLPGARYIVPAGAGGAWAGMSGRIAARQNGVWTFYAPVRGWLAFVRDDDRLCVWDDSAWTAALTGADRLGVNTAADATNRLAVASAASLFTHAGADHRLCVNKATAAHTASLVFSDDFSGRAEFGLAGDDQFRIKVSADGTTWRTALEIDGSNGRVSFPAGFTAPTVRPSLLLNGDFRINQRSFMGGALAADVYGFDRWKAATGGASLSLGSGGLALASGGIVQVVEPAVWGLTSLAGQMLTIGVDALSGGSLRVTAGTATGTIASGGGSLTLTPAATDTGPLPIRISVASGTPVLARVKVELGAQATPWQERTVPDELRLCQRYFETSVPIGQNPATYAPGAGSSSIYLSASPDLGSVTALRYLVPKRVPATLTIRDGAANAGRISVYNGAWINNYAFTGVLGGTDKGFSLQQNNSGVYSVAFDFSAAAEL